jgi:hypothetical protein
MSGEVLQFCCHIMNPTSRALTQMSLITYNDGDIWPVFAQNRRRDVPVVLSVLHDIGRCWKKWEYRSVAGTSAEKQFNAELSRFFVYRRGTPGSSGTRPFPTADCCSIDGRKSGGTTVGGVRLTERRLILWNDPFSGKRW